MVSSVGVVTCKVGVVSLGDIQRRGAIPIMHPIIIPAHRPWKGGREGGGNVDGGAKAEEEEGEGEKIAG